MGVYHVDSFTDAMHKSMPLDLYLRVVKNKYTSDEAETSYRVLTRFKHNSYADFRAHTLPGCCGVLVVYYLRPVGKKPTPVFERLTKLIVKAAGLVKYGAVLFTQVNGTDGDKALLKLSNNVHTFTNYKTKNNVSIHVLHTEAPKEPKPKKIAKFDGE